MQVHLFYHASGGPVDRNGRDVSKTQPLLYINFVYEDYPFSAVYLTARSTPNSYGVICDFLR